MLYQLEILQTVAVWVLTPGNYFSVIFSYISSTLKMETACLYETSVPKCQNSKCYNLKNYHRENVYSSKDPGLLKTEVKSKLCMECERGSGRKRTDIRQGIDRISGFFEDNFDKRDALWAMPQTRFDDGLVRWRTKCKFTCAIWQFGKCVS
jgi:hypothetical protein